MPRLDCSRLCGLRLFDVFANRLIQTSFEATAILLTFYWAPWIFLVATDHHPPYGVVFATFTVAATAGSYAFQIFASNKPAERTLRILLLTSTGTCLLGAMMSHSTTVLMCCIVVQVCIGMYWPCIGVLRGRHIPNEVSDTSSVCVPHECGTLVVTT